MFVVLSLHRQRLPPPGPFPVLCSWHLSPWFTRWWRCPHRQASCALRRTSRKSHRNDRTVEVFLGDRLLLITDLVPVLSRTSAASKRGRVVKAQPSSLGESLADGDATRVLLFRTPQATAGRDTDIFSCVRTLPVLWIFHLPKG